MSRRFENFSQRLAAEPAQQVPDEPELPEGQPPEPDETEDPDHSDKDDSMTETTEAALAAARKEGHAEGVAEGRKAERDRMNTVFASEHFAGREAHAAKLLGKDMSADDVVDLLADFPKTQPAGALTEDQQREAAEEGGRQEMANELGKNKPGGIDANDGDGKSGANEDAPKSKAAKILADHRAYTGQKPKAPAN